MDKKCSSCPVEVTWQSVDTNHLFKHPAVLSIQLIRVQRTCIPHYLQEDNIQEFKLEIEFGKTSFLEIEEYIQKVGYCVFDSNTETSAWGTVFKREKKRGYWALRVPCLYCYQDLLQSCEEEQLKRAVLLTYL